MATTTGTRKTSRKRTTITDRQLVGLVLTALTLGEIVGGLTVLAAVPPWVMLVVFAVSASLTQFATTWYADHLRAKAAKARARTRKSK